MQYFFYYPNFEKIRLNSHVCNTGVDHWVLDTYRHLKKLNLKFNVNIGDTIPDEGVIFFHRSNFPAEYKPNNTQLFVCFQVDRGRHPFAQCHIVHNPFQVYVSKFPLVFLEKSCFQFADSFYQEPWPINYLLKRSQERGNKISQISYHGNIINLPEEIRSQKFHQFLYQRNLKFKIYESPEHWNDFSETDLSICIRDFKSRKSYSKPFLKITNSLLAGVPVIGGVESSSLFFKKNKLDIPLAKNYDDLINIINLIIENKYDPFVQLQKFQKIQNEFNEEGVLLKWLKLINSLDTLYLNWINATSFKKELFITFRKMTAINLINKKISINI